MPPDIVINDLTVVKSCVIFLPSHIRYRCDASTVILFPLRMAFFTTIIYMWLFNQFVITTILT